MRARFADGHAAQLPLDAEVERSLDSRVLLEYQVVRIIKVDSSQWRHVAGVALLLEWVRDAHANHASLSFINAPAQMRAIIDFCALNDVIRLRRPAKA